MSIKDLSLQTFREIIHGTSPARIDVVHGVELFPDSFSRSKETGFGHMVRRGRGSGLLEVYICPVV